MDPRTSPWPGLVVALIVVAILSTMGHEQALVVTAGTGVLCILWWIFEPIPIPVTSLVPLAVFPLSGVLTANETAQAYGSPLILLLLGGFLLSRGMESTGAHRRIALTVINIVGGHSPRRLVLGFMATGALLSMWISNTATVLMLLPVALAVLSSASDRKALAPPLLLGLAWSCSIGGIGTPIGTPPNLLFMQVYAETTGNEIGFSRWMMWAIPVVVLMIPLTWLWLTRSLPGSVPMALPEVGPWRSAERRVLVVFAITALAWMTRAEPFGGWRYWLSLPGASDASVALLAVVLLFLVRDDEGNPLINWDQAAEIPWGILILFGGGIAIAKAFVASGLSDIAGQAVLVASELPRYALLIVVCLFVTFLTEATSNTATTALLMPILAAAAVAGGLDPALLMAPAAMAASCAFMLPVATAPNAVVFGSGEVPIRRMARDGLVVNLIGVVVLATAGYVLLPG